mmetsp:Transcript_1789/g.7805  ORF Transcript_1789/g.7805 Transcript_1789/m.7805 type:complete len:276 (-) Transcript_1789:51-878(-)
MSGLVMGRPGSSSVKKTASVISGSRRDTLYLRVVPRHRGELFDAPSHSFFGTSRLPIHQRVLRSNDCPEALREPARRKIPLQGQEDFWDVAVLEVGSAVPNEDHLSDSQLVAALDVVAAEQGGHVHVAAAPGLRHDRELAIHLSADPWRWRLEVVVNDPLRLHDLRLHLAEAVVDGPLLRRLGQAATGAQDGGVGHASGEVGRVGAVVDQAHEDQESSRDPGEQDGAHAGPQAGWRGPGQRSCPLAFALGAGHGPLLRHETAPPGPWIYATGSRD